MLQVCVHRTVCMLISVDHDIFVSRNRKSHVLDGLFTAWSVTSSVLREKLPKNLLTGKMGEILLITTEEPSISQNRQTRFRCHIFFFHSLCFSWGRPIIACGFVALWRETVEIFASDVWYMSPNWNQTPAVINWRMSAMSQGEQASDFWSHGAFDSLIHRLCAVARCQRVRGQESEDIS